MRTLLGLTAAMVVLVLAGAGARCRLATVPRSQPRRNHRAEQGWLEKWPEGGPKMLWKANVGQGFSGVAISGGRLFTMGHLKPKAGGAEEEEIDQVWCLDAATGARSGTTVTPARKAPTGGPTSHLPSMPEWSSP